MLQDGADTTLTVIDQAAEYTVVTDMSGGPYYATQTKTLKTNTFVEVNFTFP